MDLRELKDKLEAKTISNGTHAYFISIVYIRAEGFFEALLFPKDGGQPINMSLDEMKASGYKLVKVSHGH